MGMDLYTYKRSDEGTNVTLTIGYLEAYKAKFPDDNVKIIRDIPYNRLQKISEESHPKHAKFVLFGQEPDGLYYAKKRHIDARDTAYDEYIACDWNDKKLRKRLNKRFEKLQKRLMKKAKVRKISDDLLEDISFETGYKFAEIGYIRKPFRHYSTEPVVEGDVITISVDNFAGVDWAHVTELLGCGDDSFAAIFDIKLARDLKKFVGEKTAWQQHVINNLKDPEVFVAMDW